MMIDKKTIYSKVMKVIYRWERGALKKVETFFNAVEDAVADATGEDPEEHEHHVKVYDKNGECVHDSKGGTNNDSYC